MSVAGDSLQNGTYTIMAYTGAFLELESSQANLTLWSYSDSLQQQWDVQVTGDGAYTLQNVQYNTYISTTTPTQIGTLVQQSSTPYNWNIRLNVTNPPQYVIATNSTYSAALNVQNGGTTQNTPVQIYTCCYVDGGWADWDLFQFIPVSTSTTSDQVSTTSSQSTWLAVAIAFIAVFGVVIVGMGTAWLLGYRCMNPRRGVA